MRHFFTDSILAFRLLKKNASIYWYQSPSEIGCDYFRFCIEYNWQVGVTEPNDEIGL